VWYLILKRLDLLDLFFLLLGAVGSFPTPNHLVHKVYVNDLFIVLTVITQIVRMLANKRAYALSAKSEERGTFVAVAVFGAFHAFEEEVGGAHGFSGFHLGFVVSIILGDELVLLFGVSHPVLRGWGDRDGGWLGGGVVFDQLIGIVDGPDAPAVLGEVAWVG